MINRKFRQWWQLLMISGLLLFMVSPAVQAKSTGPLARTSTSTTGQSNITLSILRMAEPAVNAIIVDDCNGTPPPSRVILDGFFPRAPLTVTITNYGANKVFTTIIWHNGSRQLMVTQIPSQIWMVTTATAVGTYDITIRGDGKVANFRFTVTTTKCTRAQANSAYRDMLMGTWRSSRSR